MKNIIKTGIFLFSLILLFGCSKTKEIASSQPETNYVTVNITSPSQDNYKLNGPTFYVIRGTAGTSSSLELVSVEINIDGNGWQAVDGLESWTYEWDLTSGISNGNHSISVRATDSTDDVAEIERIIAYNDVSNPTANTDNFVFVDCTFINNTDDVAENVYTNTTLSAIPTARSVLIKDNGTTIAKSTDNGDGTGSIVDVVSGSVLTSVSDEALKSVAFRQDWNTQPYTSPAPGATTVNSVNGILNVTSTSADPMINMYTLGSFNPAVYKYIQIRYRVTSGTAGGVEIFFTNVDYPAANGAQQVNGSLVSDGNWHIATINMSTHALWDDHNITGWRYDWATASGVTMELDYILLTSNANIEFIENWNTQPYSSIWDTTVNSVTDGILNVTSTAGDPSFTMSGLGSFNPAIYKYIQIRYRVTAGDAGSAEIFFTNAANPAANQDYAVSSALVSDGNWQVVNIDMSAHEYWDDSNVTGWRYDWAGASGVTMDIDYICLSPSESTVLPDTDPTVYVAGVLANKMVAAGTVKIKVGGTQVGADNGSGIITGSGIDGEGTINYDTGAITFTLAEDQGTEAVTVDYGIVNSIDYTTGAVIFTLESAPTALTIDYNTGDGTMALPFSTIQPAIDAAADAGKDVCVSKGTYIDAGTDYINMKDEVSLYGGYDASDNWSKNIYLNSTIIKRINVTPVSAGLNKEPLSTIAADDITATIDGFSIYGPDLDGMTSYATDIINVGSCAINFKNGGSAVISNNQIFGGNVLSPGGFSIALRCYSPGQYVKALIFDNIKIAGGNVEGINTSIAKTYGIYLRKCDAQIFDNTRITGGMANDADLNADTMGIYFNESDPVITGNSMIKGGNTGNNCYGIMAYHNSGGSISNNVVITGGGNLDSHPQNTTGIILLNQSDVTITGNTGGLVLDESLAVAANSFTGTLSSFTLMPGGSVTAETLVIKFNNIEAGRDDGLGAITASIADVTVTGTIDYITGAVVINTSPVTSGIITASYEYRGGIYGGNSSVQSVAVSSDDSSPSISNNIIHGGGYAGTTADPDLAVAANSFGIICDNESGADISGNFITIDDVNYGINGGFGANSIGIQTSVFDKSTIQNNYITGGSGVIYGIKIVSDGDASYTNIIGNSISTGVWDGTVDYCIWMSGGSAPIIDENTFIGGELGHEEDTAIYEADILNDIPNAPISVNSNVFYSTLTVFYRDFSIEYDAGGAPLPAKEYLCTNTDLPNDVTNVNLLDDADVWSLLTVPQPVCNPEGTVDGNTTFEVL